jgi:nucleoid DNA-binding protein
VSVAQNIEKCLVLACVDQKRFSHSREMIGKIVKKNDLVAIIQGVLPDSNSRRDAVAVVETVFNEIARSLSKGDAVQIAGFGTFKKKVVPARKARPGRNPFTGENIMLKAKPASSKPTFTSAKVLKDVVSGKAKVAAPAKPAAKPAAKKATKKAAPKKAAKKVVKKAAKKAAPKKSAKKVVKKVVKKAAPKKAAKKTSRKK